MHVELLLFLFLFMEGRQSQLGFGIRVFILYIIVTASFTRAHLALKNGYKKIGSGLHVSTLSAVVLLTAIFRWATCTVLSIPGRLVKPRGDFFF